MGADPTLGGDLGLQIPVWRPHGDTPPAGQSVQPWNIDLRRATPDPAIRDERRRRSAVTRSVRVDRRLLDLRADPRTALVDRVGIDVADTDPETLDRLVRAEAFLLAANGIEWVALTGSAAGDCFLQLCTSRAHGAVDHLLVDDPDTVSGPRSLLRVRADRAQ
jgi:hypothetical protein